uniref:Ubiquitin-like protease family profile domain-containing protein n=1 Tax=Ditylenchus dipsaci TaxID=166011 RepID=A0A915D0T6_9BILA
MDKPLEDVKFLPCFQETKQGQQFLLYDSRDAEPGQSVIFIFLSELGLRLLHPILLEDDPLEKVCMEKFRIALTQRDLQRFNPEQWLNDQAINFCMQLIVQRCQSNDSLPSIYVFESFFWIRLELKGPKAMLSWTTSVDVFDYEMLFLPVHTPGHWSLVMVDLENGKLLYFDSLHSDGTKHLNLLKDFLAEFAEERGYATVDPSHWLCLCPKDIPKQKNSFDCGVFVCNQHLLSTTPEYLHKSLKMTDKKLKIVFWSSDDSKSLPLEFNGMSHKILQEALSHRFIKQKLAPLKIDSVDQPQTLGEEEYDPRIEYLLQLSGIESNDQLLQMLNFLLGFLRSKTENASSSFHCSVVLLSKDFFDVDFCSAQMKLSTRNFSFNNIVDRAVPMIHRQVTIQDDRKKILARFFNQNVNCTILTDFEHDRRQMILRFPYSETQHREQGPAEVVDFTIALNVRYKTIRRILVNIKECPSSETAEKQYINLLTKHGDRYTAWDKRRRILADEINESPIFKVELFNLGTFTEAHNSPFSMYVESPLVNEYCKKRFDGNFKLMYMFEALLSRGAVVKDYLLTSEKSRDDFVDMTVKYFREDKAVALEVLERLLGKSMSVWMVSIL